MPRNKKSRIRTPPVTAVLNAAELYSGFLAFPSGECQHKRLQALRPRLTPGLPKFSVLRDVPGCWYYPTQSGMQKVSFGGGALIFPPGHPALALALFYQIWPCPCKCPNGHKNGICGCFYPKSAISCRDCPTNPPKSLCTPPTKSYKFVSANPCETDAGRINKYDYTGCVGGSFWNFIRFRDFPEALRNAKASHFERLPRPGEVARKCRKGARWHGEAVTERARMLTKSKKHSDTSPVCQRHRIAVLSCFILPGLPSQALARQLSQRESPWQRGQALVYASMPWSAGG